MSVFKKEEFVAVTIPDMAPIAQEVADHFQRQGFTVAVDPSLLGPTEVSLHKPGIFRSVVGLKTALKVYLEPVNGGTQVRAEIGAWGHHTVPVVIGYMFWPILCCQMWGLIQQSKLDDEAVRVAREILHRNNGKPLAGTAISSTAKHCAQCGHVLPAGGRFCPGCGNAQT